jgi:FtsZ-binding cell division protein ZapB
MLFNFKGNPKGIHGTFNLKHKDLKIAILDKKNHEKKGVLTAVANLFIKTDSGKFPEEVVVENVERDPTKSFFNLFWRGIEDGLKKTLIGKNVGKTETKVKKAVSAVKEMKSSVNELKQEVKNTKDQKQQENIQPKEKKKGFLKNVFKKKKLLKRNSFRSLYIIKNYNHQFLRQGYFLRNYRILRLDNCCPRHKNQ